MTNKQGCCPKLPCCELCAPDNPECLRRGDCKCHQVGHTPPAPYNQRDHSHCFDQKSPACGQKIDHLYCCLCKKPNVRGWKECQTQPALEDPNEIIHEGMDRLYGTPEKQEWDVEVVKEIEALMMYRGSMPEEGKLLLILYRLLSQTRKDTLEEVCGDMILRVGHLEATSKNLSDDDKAMVYQRILECAATLEALEKKIGAI